MLLWPNCPSSDFKELSSGVWISKTKIDSGDWSSLFAGCLQPWKPWKLWKPWKQKRGPGKPWKIINFFAETLITLNKDIYLCTIEEWNTTKWDFWYSKEILDTYQLLLLSNLHFSREPRKNAKNWGKNLDNVKQCEKPWKPWNLRKIFGRPRVWRYAFLQQEGLSYHYYVMI